MNSLTDFGGPKYCAKYCSAHGMQHEYVVVDSSCRKEVGGAGQHVRNLAKYRLRAAYTQPNYPTVLYRV
jgi:hypothetical protein